MNPLKLVDSFTVCCAVDYWEIMSFIHSDNKLVTCPYDEAHKLKASRLQLHIAKCKLNHLDKIKEPCPFNASHLLSPSERDFHLMNCPDRAPLDRSISQNALDKNNPFKGQTAVPHFSDPLESQEESWDEGATNNFGTNNFEPPPGAIIEPQPMSKPSERRKLYMELHRLPSEADGEKPVSNPLPAPVSNPLPAPVSNPLPAPVSNPLPASNPSPMRRQPKQLSEVLQSGQQQVNTQTIQKLGLGRGKPPRIAANIFDNVKSSATGTENSTYSNIVKDISNLGLGRGQPASQDCAPLFIDDEDFPVLGCGRGALRAPKQKPRIPGVKSRK